MNPGEMSLHPQAEVFLNWLINRSLQAGVLVLMVLLVQAVFRRQLTSRWRFALWWIPLLRLLLPVGPESAVSLFNFVKPSVSIAGPRHDVASLPATPPERAVQPPANDFPATVMDTDGGTAATPTEVGMPTGTGSQTPVVGNGGSPVPGSPRARLLRFEDYWVFPSGLILLWAAVAVVFCLVVVTQSARFRRKLSRSAAPADPALVELLAECRRDIRVARCVELQETDAVTSPALWGLLRLRILLPRGMAAKFTRRELRYIFLHELAHVKRGDLWLNWLLTALQFMHWFNPLIWIGFARLRADRELACDELALVSAGETAGTAYGQTVIKLLEGLSRPRAVPGLIGILEDKKQMRRRISMLASFRRPGRKSALAVILLGMVAAVALTDAQRNTALPAVATPITAQGTAIPGGTAIQLTPPKPIPGATLKGTVLSPDGSPAMDAQMALRLGPGYSDGPYKSGLDATTGPDGRFSLPLYEAVQSVIVFSTEGIARVSLADLQASPKIQLQKWGRIEGTLMLGSHPGSNENLSVGPAVGSPAFRLLYGTGQWNSSPPLHDIEQTRTDAQGRFVFDCVPPGELSLDRMVTFNSGDSSGASLGTVEVKPGETAQVRLGGTGRAVVGRLKPPKGVTNAFREFHTELLPAAFDKLMAQMRDLTTEEARSVFSQTDEYVKAERQARIFPIVISSDGSFTLEDVLPGTYKLDSWTAELGGTGSLLSSDELVVPQAKTKDDHATVDLGTINLKKITSWPPATAQGASGAPKKGAALSTGVEMAALSSPASAVAADVVHPDLTGAVFAKDGSPLTATVFIATAAPKIGTSTFCPSCYADCIKSAKADAEGDFKIASLDPQLTFKILAVAKGYQPKYVSKVDPATGPVRVVLDPIAAADAAPDRSLRGRVVNTKGEPVVGAVVQRDGYRMKDGQGMWGVIDWIDPLAVTDENGEFLLTAKKPFDMLDVTVQARTFADKKFTQLSCGRTKDLVIAEGATITGRVVAGGQPVQNIVVGVAGVQRDVMVWVGHFEVGTGENGRFSLVNLPPDTDYYIYGLMDSTRPYGAIPIQTVHTGKDGDTRDMDDLVAQPAHRLAGRVELADGSTIPPNTRLLIGRNEAWDTTQITLGPDGAFETTGVPAEQVSLSVRVPGFHISGQNASRDPLNDQLVGRVNRDLTNLVFLLEKGPAPEPDYNLQTPQDQLPQNLPLRGVEGGVDHSHDWTITGHVVDRETHQPISSFRVTPGQSDAINRTNWDSPHGVVGKDGGYSAYVSRRVPQPSLKVEADGYLPAVMPLPERDVTNFDFVLTKGSGPQGVVLSPDGSPAAGVTVVLLGDDGNDAQFTSTGGFNATFYRSRQQKTDASGHFAFKPEWGTRGIGAATSDGFALVNLDSLAANLTLRLEPYGRITGTVKRTSGPAAKEELGLGVAQMSAGPQFNLNLNAVTDSDGKFTFEHVPPMNLVINDLVPMSGSPGAGGGRMIQRLQDVSVKAGKTTDLAIKTVEHPAPIVWTPPPVPQRIPGASIKGTVLLPDGRPAAEVQVALQIEGVWLSLARGTFNAAQPGQEDMRATTAPDGGFTLPLFEKTQSVAAVSDEGFAQMSLAEFQASPQIHLQKWGRIEGTLRVGRHLASNEVVQVIGKANNGYVTQSTTVNDANAHSTTTTIVRQHDPETNRPSANRTGLVSLQYDYNAFRTKTDAQGKFVFEFLPPGPQLVDRSVPLPSGSGSTSYLVGVVDVQPGETSKVTLGGNGRELSGKLSLGKDEADGFIDLGGANFVPAPLAALVERRYALKTDEERFALDRSQEYIDAVRNNRSFPATISPDGSIHAEDVLPGSYRFIASSVNASAPGSFFSTTPLVVPAAKNTNDDSAVDFGGIDLKKITFPPPSPQSGLAVTVSGKDHVPDDLITFTNLPILKTSSYWDSTGGTSLTNFADGIPIVVRNFAQLSGWRGPEPGPYWVDVELPGGSSAVQLDVSIAKVVADTGEDVTGTYSASSQHWLNFRSLPTNAHFLNVTLTVKKKQ